MWSETLGPGVSVDNTKDEEWMGFQKQQLHEMLDNALNHASIMTWGWFNEGPSNNEHACPAYQTCADIANARDGTRFTTWASDKDLSDKCLAAASLISFNNYPGWHVCLFVCLFVCAVPWRAIRPSVRPSVRYR